MRAKIIADIAVIVLGFGIALLWFTNMPLKEDALTLFQRIALVTIILNAYLTTILLLSALIYWIHKG